MARCRNDLVISLICMDLIIDSLKGTKHFGGFDASVKKLK